MTVCPARDAALRRARAARRDRRASSSRNRRLPIATVRPSTCPLTPCPVDRRELLHRRQRDMSARARPRRSPRRGDARSRFPGSPQDAATSPRREAPCDTTVTSRGLPSVSVPVLSTTSVVICSSSFERFGIPEQHAGLRAAAGAHHDRHRRGEPERARARDDEHGNRIDERVGEPRLRPHDRPRDERQDRNDHDRWARTTPTRCRPGAESARAIAAPR